MMTSGCYSTLWSLYEFLTAKAKNELGTHDALALQLARRWMGLDGDIVASDKTTLRKAWRCQRYQCVFHARHCRHGANPGA
jgi:hypothetical protein